MDRWIDTHATDDDHALDADRRTQGLKLLADLNSKLSNLPHQHGSIDQSSGRERSGPPACAGVSRYVVPRRREHQAEERRRVVEQRLQDRDRKGSGLARASLCETDDISASERHRDGFLLDLRRLGEAHLLAREHQRLAHAELLKGLGAGHHGLGATHRGAGATGRDIIL